MIQKTNKIHKHISLKPFSSEELMDCIGNFIFFLVTLILPNRASRKSDEF